MSDLTRRSFFGRLAAALAAVPLARFIGIRSRTPAIGGIDHATYAFWRNQRCDAAWEELPPLDPEMMRKVYDQCSSGGNFHGLQYLTKGDTR